jgi:flavocytochrome c
MTITYALMEKLDELARTKPELVKIILKARVSKLLQDADGNVNGVEYQHNGQTHTAYGPVILATGGYAADFAPDGLIQKYRPDIMSLPTTNGEHSTGDGIKMVRAIGGNSIDMEKVQVHPTGLVDPNEPDAKVKFLAAEALRGVGGLLLTNDGKRFCDELGHRDYVTGEMWKFKKPPYRLVLNGAASKEIEWHCKHYMGRGLMKRYANGADLAKDMGIPVAVLEETFKKYNEGAKNNSDPFGKKYFHNLPFVTNDEFYVAIVTPVVHYCMGGLEINHEGEVLGPKGSISGLFAAGEVAGGVHGANRLGGSSLLGCVVYGRVAGDSASRYLFQKLINQPGRASGPGQLDAIITQNGVQTKVTVSWGQGTGATASAPSTQSSAPSSAPAPATSAPAPAKKDTNKEYTVEEVAKHNTEKDCWVIVNGQVLDVTHFLKDHPGGKKAILIYAGRDATEEFNMLHKPDVVEKYAPESIIGRVKPKSKL